MNIKYEGLKIASISSSRDDDVAGVSRPMLADATCPTAQ